MALDLTIDIKGNCRFPIDRKNLRHRLEAVLLARRVSGAVSISVSIVGDRKMRQINRTYRQKDYSTDVLSFPTYDPTQPMEEGGFAHPQEVGLVLGDLIIAYPQAVKIASAKNKLLDEVVGDLAEHGLLHLLGIHHD